MKIPKDLGDDVSELLTSGEEPDLIVIEADCDIALRWMPDSTINLTITDPAYESLERHRAKGTTTRLKDSKASSNAWFDTYPNENYWSLFPELHRLHAPNSHCYVFCDSETEHVIISGRNPYWRKNDKELQKMLKALPDLPSRPTIDWTVWPPLTWVKTKQGWVDDELSDAAIRAGMGYHWRRSDERILFLEKGKRKLHNLSEPNILCGTRAGKGDYPTQKPASVVSRLIKNSSDPDDLVLDVFAGSGVVGFEALKLGRRAILIDLDVSWIVDHLHAHVQPHYDVRVFRSKQ